jgi:beta-phosphoglucomutase-like phosphatase (HAD superfamily)
MDNKQFDIETPRYRVQRICNVLHCHATSRTLRANKPSSSASGTNRRPEVGRSTLLAGLRIAHRFKALVIGDELAHGKPHPLPYLEALRATGAAVGASLAFEDSRAGVRSAAAGIPTVGIRTSLGHDDLVAAGAVTSAASFESPELLELIAARMKG